MTGQREEEDWEGVVALWWRGKIFGTGLFLPSDNIRPKSESIEYLIRFILRIMLNPALYTKKGDSSLHIY